MLMYSKFIICNCYLPINNVAWLKFIETIMQLERLDKNALAEERATSRNWKGSSHNVKIIGCYKSAFREVPELELSNLLTAID
jgi:hypothetical protein